MQQDYGEYLMQHEDLWNTDLHPSWTGIDGNAALQPFCWFSIFEKRGHCTELMPCSSLKDWILSISLSLRNWIAMDPDLHYAMCTSKSAWYGSIIPSSWITWTHPRCHEHLLSFVCHFLFILIVHLIFYLFVFYVLWCLHAVTLL